LVHLGSEFWVKICTSFGWSPSEWGWQVLLAIILWKLRLSGYPNMMAYVDNLYCLFGGDIPLGPHMKRLKSFMSKMNIPPHEWHVGKVIKFLGWTFDFSKSTAPFMECPPERFATYRALIASLQNRKVLTLKEVEKAVGMLTFIVAGFSIGRADIAHLVYIRTAGVRAHRKAQARARRFVPS